MKTKGRLHKQFFLSLALTLVLAACGRSGGAPTPDLSALATAQAATLQALAPTETSTPSITPTPSDTPTPTLTPTITDTPTVTPSNTPALPCHSAQLVADITIPDGMRINKSATFTKTWRVRNTGACTWTTGFRLVFISGTNLASGSSYNLPAGVVPGGSIDLSLNMTAPSGQGDYESRWNLRSETGVNFGTGANANTPLSVSIVVSDQALDADYDFAANFCSANWSNNSGSLPCPGVTSDTKGYVRFSTSAELEHAGEDELMLLLRPNHISNGFIEGIYPNYQVKSGDRFIGRVGCQANSDGCQLRFVLLFQDSNGDRHQVEDWTEEFDGDTSLTEIDLSSIAGSTVRFILRVEVLNTDYADANGFWLLPSIQNP